MSTRDDAVLIPVNCKNVVAVGLQCGPRGGNRSL